eukprot:CAMPEP_0198207714 /NCGR_PEP_ID=MMETSP1445-20131203/11144_1 /TAXON_ID=36898 /ORGANISM="Pyramimonas sp., Strain CCMP2087" /LENGTH=102 /DNA_ID=CAMNT_0043880851 /DNA_START=442 /DNA_END=746 /DNA_ORIENTATION=-
MSTSMGTLPLDLRERLCTAVKAGADVARCDAHGLTALHHAAYCGNVETARAILELGGKLSVNARSVTPLHLVGAETEGRRDLARELEDMGYYKRARAENAVT